MLCVCSNQAALTGVWNAVPIMRRLYTEDSCWRRLAGFLLQFRHAANTQYSVPESSLCRLWVHARSFQPKARVPTYDACDFRRNCRRCCCGTHNSVWRVQDSAEHTGAPRSVTTWPASPWYHISSTHHLPTAWLLRVLLRHNGTRSLSDSIDSDRVGGLWVLQVCTDEGLAPPTAVSCHTSSSCHGAFVHWLTSLEHNTSTVICYTGWLLVWKTWKCQGFWQLSGKCRGFH